MYIYLLLLGAMVVFMWFMQRKQRAEQARVAAMQDSLSPGDHVVTVSGLYGTVVEVDDTTVDLEIAEDVVTTWLRSAIREVRKDDEETAPTEIPNDSSAIQDVIDTDRD